MINFAQSRFQREVFRFGNQVLRGSMTRVFVNLRGSYTGASMVNAVDRVTALRVSLVHRDAEIMDPSIVGLRRRLFGPFAS